MTLLLVASGDFFADYGGGQVYVRRLVDELSHPEYRVDVSVLSVDEAFPEQPRERLYQREPSAAEGLAAEGEVTVYELSPRGDVAALLRRVRPDVVHAHGLKVAVAAACREVGVPCVVTAHHGGICCPAGTLMNHRRRICRAVPERRRCLRCYLHTVRGARWLWPLTRLVPWHAYINIGVRSRSRGHFVPLLSPVAEAALAVQDKLDAWRSLSRDATLFIAPSQALADALVRSGANAEKVKVLPHGVPDPPKNLKDSKDPKDLTAPKALTRFYYCGRMAPVKGVDVLLRAWRRARRSGLLQAELHLMGTAATRSEARYLRRLRRRSRHDPSVVWHGKVDHPETFAAHCLLHPAVYLEAFGLDMAEALMAGRWVIASRCGGAEQQIADGRNGWIVPPGDAQALSDALLRYATLRPSPQAPRPLTLAQHASDLLKVLNDLNNPKTPKDLNVPNKE